MEMNQLPPTNTNPTIQEQPTPVIPGQSKREKIAGALSTILILITAPIIAILLTTYVFQSYEVDGVSMETTLQDKDRLIILKVPRTWARITHEDYIPNRGDIIVFEKSEALEAGVTRDKQLIKRVIGVPGDRVIVKDGVLTIYNRENPDGFQPDETMDYKDNVGITNGFIDVYVKEGELFVCGDNRSNSLDSRSFGTISADDIIGKLGARILPFGKAKLY